MNQIVIDNETKSRLGDFTEPVEICDATGRVLARLLPVVDLADVEACRPDISEEELQRREREDKWYTTQEVLDHLESL
jgi:hypothetical protein